MKEVLATGRTLSDAYHNALLGLYYNGQTSDCADWKTTQLECSMTMTVEEPLSEPMISRMFIGGAKELEQYRQEMLDGILDFEVDAGKWSYTYHDRMVRYPTGRHGVYIDQIQFVIAELKRNPSSRRAVIIIRDPTDDCWSDDPACLQHIQYFIRDGKLECDLLFRSNDACKATFMNAFALIMLQNKMAKKLGVQVGSYTHRANSFHCYEKDLGLLKSYVNRIESGRDTTYDYKYEFKEIMDDYADEISEAVEELKERNTRSWK